MGTESSSHFQVQRSMASLGYEPIFNPDMARAMENRKFFSTAWAACAVAISLVLAPAWCGADERATSMPSAATAPESEPAPTTRGIGSAQTLSPDVAKLKNLTLKD